MKQTFSVILKKNKERSILRRHPWVFSGAIQRIEPKGQPANGEVVRLKAADGSILGTGHFQAGSISIRLLSFDEATIDQHFWNNKIQDAHELRQTIGLVNADGTNCYRLVHGEGDGLPGLVIDYYDGIAVMQCHSAGMYLARHEISEALKVTLGAGLKSVYCKSEDTLAKNTGLTAKNEYLLGTTETPLTITENHYLFDVNWVTGQKTGFFLDQRDNRALLARYAKEKTVLNTFCYTGGFSVYALGAGAKEVHSVDSSVKAIELTEANVEKNGFQKNHQAFTGETIKFLQQSEAGIYNLIVLDPPAYAKHLSAKHNAIQGYKRLNELAIRKIKKGGLLFTFSCSQVVDRQLFYNTITAAAIEAGRTVSVLHHLGQPADHPVSIYHPEGEYLKGLVLEVS